MKKNLIIIIVLVLLLISGGVLAYFFTSNNTSEFEITPVEIMQAVQDNIAVPQKINTTGTIKINWDYYNNNQGNISIKTDTVTLISLQNQKLSFDSKNIITGTIADNLTNLNLDFKDLNLDFKFSLIENKIYLKLNTDLNKIVELIPDQETKNAVLMGGLMILDKDYLIDLNTLPAEIRMELTDIVNIEKMKFELNTQIKLIEKHNPITLLFTGKTEKINGKTAQQYEVIFDTKKIINFIADWAIISLENEKNQLEESLISITEMKRQIENTKNSLLALNAYQDILEKNISGNIFIWVTKDGTIVQEEIDIKVDLANIINEFFARTERKTLDLSANIELNLKNLIKFNEDIEIAAPQNAIDLMSLFSGMMPAVDIHSQLDIPLESPIINVPENN